MLGVVPSFFFYAGWPPYWHSKMALLRVGGFLWVLLLRNQNCPGSQSRARMPALVQVGLDSAYFQTQYTKHPSCCLQLGPGWTREVKSRRHSTSRTGTESEQRIRSDFPFVISTIAPSIGIVARSRRRRHHLYIYTHKLLQGRPSEAEVSK